MALVLHLFAIATDAGGAFHRINIFKEGGNTTRRILMTGDTPGVFLVDEYGDPSDGLHTTIRASRHSCIFFPVDISTKKLDQDALDDLRAIATGGLHDYLMIHLIDDVEFWRGWVAGTATTSRAYGRVHGIQVFATDRIQSLDRQDFRGASSQLFAYKPLRVVIAEMLASTGHDLEFTDQTTAKASSETGDPLDQKINQERLWQQRNDLEEIAYESKLTALHQVLRIVLGQVVQSNGKYRVTSPGAMFAGDTLERRTYDTAGVKILTTTTAPSFFELDASTWHDPGELRGSEAVGEARVRYSPGPFAIGQVYNGSFETWGGGDGQVPQGWTYDGAGGFFRRGSFSLDIGPAHTGPYRFGLEMKNAVTLTVETPTVAQMRPFAVNWMSQDIGTFVSGTTEVRLSWLHQLAFDSDPVSATLEEQSFVRIKLKVGVTTYYWVRSSPSVPHDGSFQIVSADVGKHDVTDRSLTNNKQEDFINITSFPGTGVVTMEFGQVVRGDVEWRSGNSDLWVSWDGLRLSRGDSESTGEESITHIAFDSTIDEGMVVEEQMLFGQGPFFDALGSIRLSDDSLAGSFKRLPAASAVPHSEMLARERLINSRDSARRIRLVLKAEPVNFGPIRAFKYDGARWWPVYVKYERQSGFEDRITVVGVEILENLSAIEDSTSSGSGASGGFGGSGARTFIDLSGRARVLEQAQSITWLSSTLANGVAVTEIDINPVATKFAVQGDVVEIQDAFTHKSIFPVLSADYVPAALTIAVNSITPDRDIFGAADGDLASRLYTDTEGTLTRLILTGQGASILVSARRLTDLKLAVTGNVTTLSSSQVNVLRHRVLNETPLSIALADGTQLDFFARDQQEAGSATLKIEATAGGGDAVDFGSIGAKIGETIQLSRDEDRVPEGLNIFFGGGIQFNTSHIFDSDFNGVINGGTFNITDIGSAASWAITRSGSFVFMGGADDYFWFNGAEFKLSAGGAGMELNSTGLNLDGDKDKFSGGSIDFWENGISSGTRVFSLGCDVDLGSIVAAYLQTLTAIDLQLLSGADIVLSPTDGVRILGAVSIESGDLTLTFGDIIIDEDNKKLLLGESQDASIFWNGNELEIVAGGGSVLVQNTLITTDDIIIDADNKKLILGEFQDATIFWNGNELEITAGGGSVLVQNTLIVDANSFFQGYLAMEDVSTPGQATAGTVRHYSDAGKLKWRDDAGTIFSTLFSFGEIVPIRTGSVEPTSNVTNFPTIGTVVYFRSASGAGSDLLAKCRTATSTYETINLGTFGTLDTKVGNLEIQDDLNHDGSNVGFYGTAPVAQQTGVPVTAAGVHAALVSLGLITA